MKNTSNKIKTISEIGMFAALGFVFDALQGIFTKGIFINGGSIGFAMIAVLIVGLRRGFLPALLTGLIMGILDVADGAYVLNFWQLCLDYIFPYMFVAFAGLLRPLFVRAESKQGKILWIIVATIVGGMGKFLSHYLAGIIFWADPSGFAWDLKDMAPALYCFVYNIAFVGPSIVLTGALLVIIYASAPKILTNKADKNEAVENKRNALELISASVVTAGGLFLFIFYLLKYIKSYEIEDYGGSFDFGFDSDCMVTMVLGLFVAITGIISVVMYFRKKFSYTFLFGGLTAMCSASLIYSVARLLKMITKGKAYFDYVIWFYIALLVLGLIAGLFSEALASKKEKKTIEE